MRLTVAIWRKVMPNGHIFRGKHKIDRVITPLIAAETRRKLEIEEHNMFLLRHPYLTLEQERGHAKELGKKEAYWKKTIDNRVIKFKPHVTLENRLAHLRVREAWD